MQTIGKPRAPGQTGPERMTRFKKLLGKEYPPYPGSSVVKPARFGGFLQLPTDAELCRESLVRSWGSAASGYPCGFRVRALDPHGSKWRAKLDAGVLALQRTKTKPAEWALFSIHVWRAHRQSFPPLVWTWSANRIQDRQEWFAEWKAEQPTIWPMFVSESAKSLVRAWEMMAQDVANPLLSLVTVADARAILDAHFPGDRYENLVDSAVVGNRRLGLRIAEDRACGGFGLL